MNNFTNKNKLAIMLYTVKIGIIAFISIIICINLPNYWIDLSIKYNGQFNLYTMGLFLFITAICYIIWLIINNKISKSSNIFRISWLIENIFFIGIISIPIHLPKVYVNEYKYLFLLLIISSVIEYGSSYGIITSLFSSACIIGADLLYSPVEYGVNIYFQKDLIVAGIFIFVAWILGYYVDMEFENNIERNEKIIMLSNELEEKNKERYNMELLLLKNKTCFDIIFENSLNAIIVHQEGIIIYANKSAAKLLGYKNPMDLDGKNFYDHYPQDIKLNLEEKYFNISSNKISKSIEEENILNCNDDFIPVRNTSFLFIYKEKPSILTLLFDITSEKRMETLEEDAEKKLKLLNETREFNNLIMNFFTNMSHELKTPVNVIFAAIQTISIHLNDYNLNDIDKCKSYLKTIKQNCFRMIKLINNLLDITKLDSGFIKVNKKNGNIVSVVEDIVQSVALYVESKNIKLIFDTDVEEKILGFDHDMMERIILNLISNAVKYSQPNKHIYVTLINKKSNIVISVKDEGDGIPENKLDVIFERFGQVNSSLSRQCEGTGIGLYLVKSFVEIHGGKISVKSSEGKGSEFTIVIPQKLVTNEDYEDKVLFKTHVERIEIEFSDVYNIN